MTPDSGDSAPTAVFDRATWTPVLELSVREVLEIMLGTPLVTIPPTGDNQGEFTALVGLAGSICGVLSTRCNREVARALAGKMLGATAELVARESWDALGEIANMIAGNFKSKLCSLGNPCMLSVPTVVVGSDYISHSPMASNVIEIVCEVDCSPLWITLELHE